MLAINNQMLQFIHNVCVQLQSVWNDNFIFLAENKLSWLLGILNI